MTIIILIWYAAIIDFVFIGWEIGEEFKKKPVKSNYMSKTKMPQTSIDAYKGLDLNSVKAVHEKILGALNVLVSASSEQIAEYTTLPHARVHKRMKELQDKGLIFRPGGRVKTKSGATAYVWQLKDNPKKEK